MYAKVWGICSYYLDYVVVPTHVTKKWLAIIDGPKAHFFGKATGVFLSTTMIALKNDVALLSTE